jgi:hypothetical protein
MHDALSELIKMLKEGHSSAQFLLPLFPLVFAFAFGRIRVLYPGR